MDVGGALAQKVGPFPVAVWAIAGVAGVVLVVRARADDGGPDVITQIEQVGIPVGATATPDYAPLVMSPVVRINVPEIDVLTGAIRDNTGALGANSGELGFNTDALGKNTTAYDANTGAVNVNTGAVNANTGAVNVNTGAVNGNTAATNALTGAIGRIPAPAAPAPQAAPAPAPAARTYLIRSGDTLWGITGRYTGNANRWGELYRANAGTIDAVARSRGKAGGGHWIFPGTTLTLPW